MKATQQMAEQSYNKAVNGHSVINDAKVISLFAERGIDATPREDVFTYNIWRNVKGRQVRKGEKSVRIVTFIEDKKTGKKRPKSAAVFHISQTDPIDGREAKFREIEPGISVMVT
jgi:hypothetical protein